MTIDLSGLIADQEDLMSDTGKITRNPGGTTDDVLDPVTLKLVPPGPETIYADGPCSVTQPTRQDTGRPTPTEAAAVPAIFVLKLPLTKLTAEPMVGDQFECTTSNNDPGLPGKKFTITKIGRSGYATARVCELETSWAAM